MDPTVREEVAQVRLLPARRGSQAVHWNGLRVDRGPVDPSDDRPEVLDEACVWTEGAALHLDHAAA